MTGTTGRGRRCAACGARRKRRAVMVIQRLANQEPPPRTMWWESNQQPTVQTASRSRSFCEPCAAALYRELVALIEAWPDPPNGG